MTQTVVSRRPTLNGEDPVKWIVVGALVLLAIVVAIVAGRIYGPIDSIVTQQACSRHGDELSRNVVEYERSRKLALTGRTDGYCEFGPIVDEDGEVVEDPATADGAEGADGEEVSEQAVVVDTVRVSLADIDTGGLYRASKWMGVILQLGVASLAVRLMGEPLLDRFVRSPE